MFIQRVSFNLFWTQLIYHEPETTTGTANDFEIVQQGGVKVNSSILTGEGVGNPIVNLRVNNRVCELLKKRLHSHSW